MPKIHNFLCFSPRFYPYDHKRTPRPAHRDNRAKNKPKPAVAAHKKAPEADNAAGDNSNR